MTEQVLTANRLRDGAVVYLTTGGDWSEDIDEARRAAPAEAEAELVPLGARAVAACEVVGPYLIEVEAGAGRVLPRSLRERIRAFGPTVSPGTPLKE